MLPYGGNSDRFDEINRMVNDPGKARLLDGLKRAAGNHFEMDRMLNRYVVLWKDNMMLSNM